LKYTKLQYSPFHEYMTCVKSVMLAVPSVVTDVQWQILINLLEFLMFLNVSLTVHHDLIIQNTNVMHLILFIRQIFSSTCFEYQVLIFRRNSCMWAAYGTVTLYRVLVSCWYAAIRKTLSTLNTLTKLFSNFFIIKLTTCSNFPNLLRHATIHVSGSSSTHHQEFIHCTLGTGICHTGL